MIGVRKTDRMGNERIKELVAVWKGVDKAINENTMRWYGTKKRMDENRMVKSRIKRQLIGIMIRAKPRKKWIDSVIEIMG